MSQAFAAYTLETAPEASRPALEGAKKKFGIVPAPLTKLAASPQFLEAFEKGNAVWQTTSLDAIEREVVTMVVATENGCDYCVALHTQILGALRAEPALIEALREERALPDSKLQALAAFTRAVLA
ncbi:MAG: carboxymuconolactone decarboxylase family protein, partial [Polyangiales bacterium]